MKLSYGLATAGLLFAVSVTTAQAQTATVEAGTSIYATLTENIHSSFNYQGETIEMRAAEPLVVDGRVVVAEGALIEAQIGGVQGSGMVGKSGTVSFHPVRITAVDGQWLPLDPTDFGDQGEGPGAGAIFAIGLFAKGRPGFVPRGTQYRITFRRDTEVATDISAPATPLAQGEVTLTGSFEEIDEIKTKKTKPGDDIELELDIPASVASLIDTGADVEIVSFDGHVPMSPVQSTSVDFDTRNNTLEVTFDWWSVLRQVPPGNTAVVVQTRLSDGRLAQANSMITTEWEVD